MLSREKSFTRQVQHLTEKLSSVLTMTSTETRTLPASVPGPPSLLSTQHNNTLAPPDTPTQPAANSQLCPSQLPSTQPEEQDPQVVLLADSNGKFLDTRKLFLIKRCCLNTAAPQAGNEAVEKGDPQEPSVPEICSNSCSLSPSPPTAAELCCSCSPACGHPPSPC
ncbi:Casein kinase I isoform delta [Dissostichus eleginoides]|uniref:Casein kinase I isoform delta n=1 Tax=Dissostichus eleginoides TaxID=100907 RepID=A0AAD9BR10_DISEL|nr:Casein kinase I isoform delta [Dissostichus eleginoides]